MMWGKVLEGNRETAEASKEAGRVSVETGRGAEADVPWGASLAGSRGYAADAGRRRASALRITEARGPAASRRRDALFRRSLLAADVCAIVVALSLTVGLSSRALQLTWGAIACVPLLLLWAKLNGLYDRDETLLRKTTLDETPKLFQAATLFALAVWLADGLLVTGRQLDRHQALFLWIGLTALLMLFRAMARAVVLELAPAERCLFIGDAKSAATVRAKLGPHGGVNAKIVAHLDLDKTAPWSTDTFSAPRLSEIRDLAQSLDVHRAIIAPGSADGADARGTLNLVRTLKAVGVRVSVLPRILEVVGSSVEFDELHGVTLMGVRRFDLTRSSAWVKHCFDLVGATVGLIAISPVMLTIALVIKLDSRGPVFFRQLRVGRHGRRFQMLKFRTMVPEADALKDSLRDRNEALEGLFKIAEDPRMTRMGRFLRRTALDELPQLFNIVKGEMSLVGPRPLVIEEDQRIEGWHRRRLELMPGMTGPWQILGPGRVPLKEMVTLDYVYVANWSLWTDIKILLRTVPHVLGRRGL
jgi:exopolysaccharide biosynthesis polyprenyl glycosylphosphotransferase